MTSITNDIDFARHVAVFGTTGSGKSTTLRTLLAGVKVPAVVWDLKDELRNWPAVHWEGGLRIAAYDLNMPKLLRASSSGANVLAELFRRHGVIATLADLRREIDQRYMPGGTRDRLIRAIDGIEPAEWIAEPTASLQEMLAHPIRHVVHVNRGYLAQADWLLSQCLALPESAELRMVIAFEEAHKLRELDLATAAKMLRSKGVGLIILSQHPRDIDPAVLGVCNTRIYHKLMGGTPTERGFLRESPPEVETLGIGECFVNGERTHIVAKALEPCESFPIRRNFSRVEVSNLA